jgi:2-polyprenyl-3-methyl-5-hydroxy-6-metoxy-1,4-benzoquinol methylase
MSDRTKEPQYQRLLDLEALGLETFGVMSSQVWREDPRRLGFLLARYKFVAKMCAGARRVLEVGCADAFGTRVVCQDVGHVVATDVDSAFIERNRARPAGPWSVEFRVHDLVEAPVPEAFDAVFSLDVLEHIPASSEDRFIAHAAQSLGRTGVCVIGTPTLESQAYASAQSRAGHVNCKDASGLRALMARHFDNVFLFSMNDEVVHTGFYPMAHYLLALCCGPKTAPERPRS